MAYELANVTTPSTQSTNQVAPAMREELTVSSSPSLDMRYKQALAKMQGKADPALQSSERSLMKVLLKYHQQKLENRYHSHRN